MTDDEADMYYDKWLSEKTSNKRLVEGPGGIMEMKQTIANKETEIDRLQKYKVFATIVANEPYELSYEKIELQRNWWKKLAIELLDKLEPEPEFTSEELAHRNKES